MAEQMMQEAAGKAIPAGYQQTEVGVIPEAWNIKELQHLCRVPITYGIVQCGPHIVNGIPYVRVSDMTDRELNVDGMLRTSVEIAAAFARSRVDEGDIIYALRGKLGHVRNVPPSVAGANLTQGTARISPLPNVSNKYIYWALQSPNALEQAAQEAKGSTFFEITLANLKKIKIPVPNDSGEQTAIANVLSDSDALIDALEQLIAKKQAIKSGTMQQLLTGRTRLPAFALRPDGTPKGYKPSELGEIPEDWELLRLGSCCHITTGKKDVNEGSQNGEYPFFTCSRNYTYSSSFSFDLEAILIAGNGEVGNLHYYNGKFEAYQRTYVLHGFIFGVWFVWYQLEFKLSESLGLGKIGSTIPYIKKGNLTEFKFFCPSLDAEQTAIATILSDMDNELQALTQKLEKARALKQGMMQQLLTGKIRLPLTAGA
ncbi:restriction endonuclease subunit S [Aeromonas caviae]|uniref:restriction endonuclease subunit S n=1 Tax=Aeromonas caviae TaxID=648 RepID=UPI00244A556E|nr:restriction endonuclease subunit S [Aeromonas caviae]MDH1637609.1 restriction endonuclease subunit S [Aeromonas caviae]